MDYSLTIKENNNSLIFALIMTSHFFTPFAVVVFFIYSLKADDKNYRKISEAFV